MSKIIATQGRLKAIKDLALGDVVYLRPDHPVYRPEHFGISARVVGSSTFCDIVRPSLDPHRSEYLETFPDRLRVVEIVSAELMCACTGLTRKALRRARTRARGGYHCDIFGMPV